MLISEVRMKFNLKELDLQVIKSRAFDEAVKIYEKPSTRKGREFHEILATCMYGQAAEVYLMTQGFSDDTRPFRDVIHPDGTPVEVKVTEGDYYVRYVLGHCKEKRLWKDSNHPDVVYVFINNKKSYEYVLHGIYVWNGEEFILQ